MRLYVNNRQDKVPVSFALLGLSLRAMRTVFSLEGHRHGEVGLTWVDDQGIRTLNRSYRGIDAFTDVLSFPMVEHGDRLLFWGDVVVSLETACRQALDYDHSLPREVSYLVVHGSLHLLGYDHEDEVSRSAMRAQEEKILNSCSSRR